MSWPTHDVDVMIESITLWGVTSYDAGGNTGYVVHALFTTEQAARVYAAESPAYDVEMFDLYEEAPRPYTYWRRGAEVYPNGVVKDWTSEHRAQPPTEIPEVDDHMGAWDGHTQGHCGLHISIFGTDRDAVERAYERQVAEALSRMGGTCPGCASRAMREGWQRGNAAAC